MAQILDLGLRQWNSVDRVELRRGADSCRNSCREASGRGPRSCVRPGECALAHKTHPVLGSYFQLGLFLTTTSPVVVAHCKFSINVDK